ncbi:MAG: 2OG-Fe(II) oxygenase [Candidatus Pelagibacter sp. TMED153]|nr:MAG: 2OG-Fe(II) oxygenase [Candidatus Pelagibacter sp. TMED153]|tara:strand:+ start:91 stop:942 length:852 start_codon:yes stop_codon:yes gene_type:complete
MNEIKILSDKFKDLDSFVIEEKQNYSKASPYPHIVIKDFFDKNFLDEVLESFPDLSKARSSEEWKNKNEVKFGNNDYSSFPDKIKLFFDFLNSNQFLDFLQKLTSIKENLVHDPELSGGGLHEIKKGGVLKIHTDFNRHPTLDLDRRINVLVYLNKNWKDSYGGDLELWDKNMLKCIKKIPPNFNTMVIFSTTDFSNHGHPDPLNCPNEISRKSLALYYFSSGRPENEIIDKHKKNRTYFKNREGINNDADEKKENFKDFLRSFKFYKFIKSIEKKYIRRNKK